MIFPVGAPCWPSRQRDTGRTVCRGTTRRSHLAGSSGTHRGSERARESCGPRAVVRSRRCQARRPKAASDTCATVRPSRPAPTGSISHVVSGLPRWTPTMSTTPSILLSSSSFGSERSASASAIVAEHLDLDRRRRAFEIAKHVLQQLNELDLEPRRLSRQLRREDRR